MANLELSGISKLGGYLLSSEGPLDVRTVVPTQTNLADLKNDYYIYPGIIVYVTDEDQHYTYTKNGTWEVFSGDQNVNSVSKNIVGASDSATANAAVTSDTAGVYLNHLEDTTVTSSHKIVGSGATTVKSSSNGVITINTPATSVSNSAPTLAWNTTSTIGTVGGTALTVTMPSNPNSNSAHSHEAGAGLTFSDDVRGGTSGTVTYKASLVNESKSTNAASYEAGGTSKFYAVQLDKNDKLGVYVPWSNTNTTYSAGSGLSLSGTIFSVNTGYTTNGTNYKVQVDSTSGGLYVSVPWSDTGVTSVEVTGSGNAVTSASYSANTRKMTLTKGSTFSLSGHTHSRYADSGHTHSVATTSTNGFMSSSDKTQLSNLPKSMSCSGHTLTITF